MCCFADGVYSDPFFFLSRDPVQGLAIVTKECEGGLARRVK